MDIGRRQEICIMYNTQEGEKFQKMEVSVGVFNNNYSAKKRIWPAFIKKSTIFIQSSDNVLLWWGRNRGFLNKVYVIHITYNTVILFQNSLKGGRFSWHIHIFFFHILSVNFWILPSFYYTSFEDTPCNFSHKNL